MKHNLFLFIFIPLVAFSWGFDAHKEINNQAVYCLPNELFSFYKQHIQYITTNAIKPDKRRYIVANEAPKHFIDLDFYTDSSIILLKPNWYEAIKLYSEDTVTKHGTLPWNILLIRTQLIDAFKKNNTELILKLSADVGHYIADANVPLHTTQNYNGQFTNQIGIHALWESRIFSLHKANYNYWGVYSTYVPSWHDKIWKTIIHSHSLVDSVLLIERQTSSQFSEDKKYTIETKNNLNTKTYSKEFCKQYHKNLNGMVETQMRKSIEDVASFWYSCWADAGKPKLTNTTINLIENDIEKPMNNTSDHDCSGNH